MSQCSLVPLDHPHVAPLAISPRMRGQLVYFMAAPLGRRYAAAGRKRVLVRARRSSKVGG